MNDYQSAQQIQKNFLSWTGVLFAFITVVSCQDHAPPEREDGLLPLMNEVGYLKGTDDYLESPYATAGDRVYMIGHQDGTFPDLGWHVEGEMGGIWDHPIKLLDGFAASIISGDEEICLARANAFFNYPFANRLEYFVEEKSLSISRFQFVPDGKEGLVVEFGIHNGSSSTQEFTFTFSATTDLRPVWLGERTGMTDGKDNLSWSAENDALMAKDANQPWYVVWGSSRESSAYDTTGQKCLAVSKGQGARGSILYTLSIDPGKTVVVPVFIAGSYRSSESAWQTFDMLKESSLILLAEKKVRYDSLERLARITIPDKKLQQAYTWIKYNTDWLLRDVPGQGRGLSAGLPDYPWWFGCDNTYALKGLLCTGRFEEVLNTIELLASISEEANGNGRIVHEVSTNGAVFNPGNINETPQFASLIWATYQWTGNKDFLEKYFPLVEKGLHWLLSENDQNRNMLPDGFGMMEIHGMDSEMIDVASYTQKAFQDATQMARVLKKDSLANHYKEIAARIRQRINEEFWVSEANSYADFLGSPSQAIELIDQAIVRADSLKKPWAVEELTSARKQIKGSRALSTRAHVVHHNWVVNTPMETGIADTSKALRALETGRKFVNPFGMFVTGIDRDETAGTDIGSVAKDRKVFSYVGAVMTLPTGVQAIAENNYKRPDKALDYLQMLTRSFNYALPGSMYEVSPDFGMIVQAWNIYALAVPIVQQFFGIQPNAGEKSVLIQPMMPESWDQASIENVLVGDQAISVYYLNTDRALKLVVRQTDPEWKVVLRYPENTYRRWLVNGKRETPEPRRGVQELVLQGDEIVIELEHQ